MKDLFVYVADADMQAVMKTVLARHRALDIRPITFDVDRHPNRDNGMFKEGADVVGLKIRKTEYSYVLLMWDHDGSGCGQRADECAGQVQVRLEQVTWKDRSKAIAIAPELEAWIWHNPPSVAKVLDTSVSALGKIAPGNSLKPKERFEQACRSCYRRKPLPGDFEKIGQTASLKAWMDDPSFSEIVRTLRKWFPDPNVRRD